VEPLLTLETPEALLPVARASTISRRDLVRPLFRHRRAFALVFASLASGVIGAALLLPPRYTAEMKVLVRHERVDPLMTANPDAGGQARSEVSDAELNSEAELLKSRDLLESVVAAAGLVNAATTPEDIQVATTRAVRRLEQSLTIAPLRKTTLIEVTYTGSDPVLAKNVLTELSRRYLEKHLTVQRPAGARQFFAGQTDRLKGELQAAEHRLVEFGRTQDVVAATAEKDATVQKLATFEASLQDLRAQAGDLGRRRQALTTEIAATPVRQTTVLRSQDNGELIRDLKARVLDLELRRTELASKFSDTYPPLVALDEQLHQARAAQVAAEQAPITEQTTDQNPTHQWLRTELSRVQADSEALQGRTAAVERTISAYRARARELDELGAKEQDLVRAVKTAEENYLLYQHKEEEARISDALDRTRIANVVLAEAPTVPALPASRALLLAAGLAVALFIALAAAFVLEYFNPYFRSRDEVWTVLELPVLAALPPTDHLLPE